MVSLLSIKFSVINLLEVDHGLSDLLALHLLVGLLDLHGSFADCCCSDLDCDSD